MRDLYRESVAMAIVDGEMEILAAGGAEGVSSVLLTFIATLADISSHSLTRREAVALLQDKIPEQEVKGFDQLLASCEVSCYAGVYDADVQALIVDAQSPLKNISRHQIRPTQAYQAHQTHRTKRWLRTALFLVACSLFAGLFGNASGSLFGAELNRDQLNQILDEASTAYQQGLGATTDAAVAKEAYARSASKYQILVDQGVKNGIVRDRRTGELKREHWRTAAPHDARGHRGQ